MSVTLIPTTFVAIKLGHPIFPTVFDLQSTPSGPLRRRNALFHRANLRTTHNASLCSVYRVFQVFARKSLARSFVMFFIRVVREFVLSLNRDPSCSLEKLSMVKSFCILYTLDTCILPRLCIPRNIPQNISLLFFATSTFKFLNILFFAISISDLRQCK